MIPDNVVTRSILQLSTIFLTSVAPLAIAYYIYFFIFHVSPLATHFSPPVVAFVHYGLGFELLFYIYFYTSRSRYQRRLRCPEIDKGSREEMIRGVMETVKDDAHSWLSGWFRLQNGKPARISDIYWDNTAEWISWAFYGRDLEQLNECEEKRREVDEIVKLLEQEYKFKFAPGYNQKIKCLRLNFDPVNAIHRPFVFYSVFIILRYIAEFLLRFMGFVKLPGDGVDSGYWSMTLDLDLKEETRQSQTYWYLKPSTSTQQQKPIVFIHGLGVGIVMYLNFIRKMRTLGHPIFIVELPYVSMRLQSCQVNASETAAMIETMLLQHGYTHATFVGHSLGSAVCAWSLKLSPKIVSGLVLLDPICFLLHYHDVAYNFVYRKPKTITEFITYFFAARELHISYYISRHFHWHQAALFPKRDTLEPLPVGGKNSGSSKTVVYLSEKDNIINSPKVYTYLKELGIETYLMPKLDHAMFVLHPGWENRVVESVRKVAIS
ncbi:uncharacterized protein VTP21DRAFT_3019 [Calcarisporiella thermophila]|uniref:uncharacterized protein n=1 Tax=Calcarisporiella thermophila TaxID=911321 RepID=UPI003742A521